ncbi:MAG: Gfo/Idh/MocA family protein [Ktedonobacterales bacterium]
MLNQHSHDQQTADGNAAAHNRATRVDEYSTLMRETAQLRFGVIGYGYWGPHLARNLSRLPLGRVTHLADLAPARREAAHWDHPSARVTESIDEVLDSDVDAVVIATPIRTHYQLARAALERGKHVLVEKPLTDSAASASALATLATQYGRVLMVGHTFMYNPAVRELRRLVQSGALGRVYYVDSIRASLGLFQKDINVIWDLAPHDISILEHIFGASPTRVSAHGGAYVRRDVNDVVQITLQYPDGMLALIHVSWLSPSKIRRFTVVGDQQMAVYDDVDMNDKIRVYNRGVDVPDHTTTFGEFQLSYRYGDVVSPHLPWSEPLAVECSHFADAILEGRAPLSDGRNGVQVVRTLEAADASLAADGMFVDIPQGKDDIAIPMRSPRVHEDRT